MRAGLCTIAGRFVRPIGLAVMPLENARPCAWGKTPIMGSYPPGSEFNLIGSKQNYFIHDGYKSRSKSSYFDDTQNSDESQREVYQFAREICNRDKLSIVADIGCGSGYKLLKYFGDQKTVGVDVSTTCAWLKKKHPKREWLEWDADSLATCGVEMVIAADIIEHLEDPDDLMLLLLKIKPKSIVMSTPDRNLLRDGSHNGPPSNPAHVREWSFYEFGAYVNSYFNVREHFISSAPQATQCIWAVLNEE